MSISLSSFSSDSLYSFLDYFLDLLVSRVGSPSLLRLGLTSASFLEFPIVFYFSTSLVSSSEEYCYKVGTADRDMQVAALVHKLVVRHEHML